MTIVHVGSYRRRCQGFDIDDFPQIVSTMRVVSKKHPCLSQPYLPAWWLPSLPLCLPVLCPVMIAAFAAAAALSPNPVALRDLCLRCRCCFVSNSYLFLWSLRSLPLPPCLAVLSPRSPTLAAYLKIDKQALLCGPYAGENHLWWQRQPPKVRQNQQNMFRKYTANSKITTQ